jgi:uncharacterized protein
MGIILPITLMAGGTAAIINIWLSVRIGQVRSATKISIGDGGNEKLIANMRAQANYVENAPFVLILLGLVEIAWGPSWWLWGVAVTFLLGRVAHGIGMTVDKGPWRIIGTLTTMLTLLSLGLLAIGMSYQADNRTIMANTISVSG